MSFYVHCLTECLFRTSILPNTRLYTRSVLSFKEDLCIRKKRKNEGKGILRNSSSWHDNDGAAYICDVKLLTIEKRENSRLTCCRRWLTVIVVPAYIYIYIYATLSKKKRIIESKCSLYVCVMHTYGIKRKWPRWINSSNGTDPDKSARHTHSAIDVFNRTVIMTCTILFNRSACLPACLASQSFVHSLFFLSFRLVLLEDR